MHAWSGKREGEGMYLSIIVAMGNSRVIGNKNQLPWHLPADLKHFKELTLRKPVIMGRKTFESIGKPLPDRRNIVISRNSNWRAEGCEVAANIDDALAVVNNAEEVMIIGGATIFAQTLQRVNKMYLTFIHADFEGDSFFPEWNKSEWHEIENVSCQPDEKNPYQYSFVTLIKK